MKSLLRILIVTALSALPQAALACSVCMGDPNSNTAKAANAAIFLMLGVLGGMFALLGAFAFSLYRRAQSPTPPHAEFGDDKTFADSLT
jgi:hypothetical protein